MPGNELASVPLQTLEEEVAKRRQAVRKKYKRYGRQALKILVRKCKGCGIEYSAREMRTHPCSMNYYRRIGKVWDKKKKKYVMPEDLSK